MKKILIILLLCSSWLFSFEHLTAQNMDEKIKGKNVIVDFYATWCFSCKVMATILKEYEKRKDPNVIIYKVAVDKQGLLADKFHIKVIPTLIYLKNGVLVNKEVGVKTLFQLESSVKAYF